MTPKKHKEIHCTNSDDSVTKLKTHTHTHKYKCWKQTHKNKIKQTKLFEKGIISSDDKPNKNAWVRFKTEESAKDAIKLNNTLIDNTWTIRVDLADASCKRDTSRCVFVGGLPETVLEDEIREHFKDCGKIENVRILRDNQTQKCKGCGYIQFEQLQSVLDALNLHQTKFKANSNQTIRVLPCLEDPKQFRKKKNTHTHTQRKHKKKIAQNRNLFFVFCFFLFLFFLLPENSSTIKFDFLFFFCCLGW